jgi:hypothetical protein
LRVSASASERLNKPRTVRKILIGLGGDWAVRSRAG